VGANEAQHCGSPGTAISTRPRREAAARFDDLAQTAIEALHGVRRVDHLADRRRKGE